MDSMAEKLEQMLSDEGTVAQIQQMLSSLREGGGASNDRSEGASQSKEEFNPAMMNSLLSVMPTLMGSAKGEADPNVDLLRALRPFLSSKRKKRVSEAVKLIKMMDMLPMLKQSGVLSGLLGGDDDE